MVNNMADITITDFKRVSFSKSLKIIPRNAISSKIAGNRPMEIIDKVKGAGELKKC